MWSGVWWILAACGWGGPNPVTCTPVADGAPVTAAGAAIQLVPVVASCGEIVDVQFAPDGTMLVVDQAGAVRWVKGDASGLWFEVDVATGNERGLLGLALHPGFAENGRFFINFTTQRDGDLQSVVEEWKATPGTWTTGDPKVSNGVYKVTQPYGNHKGGDLAFGPDGMLYVGWGDGGKYGDPHLNGQNKATALGTMLRLDVNGAKPFAVPEDNPFVGQPDALPEVWSYGLRNPWRYSFDDKGRLVAGDVGQNSWEEVTFVVAGGNNGWNPLEGTHCYAETPCSAGDTVLPIWEYDHQAGQSVTGGVMSGHGPHKGKYLFGDYLSGRIWALALPDAVGKTAKPTELGKFDNRISTFARDNEGRVYLADWTGGHVYRIDSVQ